MVVSITGATGFIGRRLVQRLHAGNQVNSSLFVDTCDDACIITSNMFELNLIV